MLYSLCPVCGELAKRVGHTTDGRTILSCGDACWDFAGELRRTRPTTGKLLKDARILGTGLFFKTGQKVKLIPATNQPHKPDEPHKWFGEDDNGYSFLMNIDDCVALD